MIDPYRPFTEAPDTLRLMLTRPSSQANQQAERAADGLTITPAPRTDHRRRTSPSGGQDDEQAGLTVIPHHQR